MAKKVVTRLVSKRDSERHAFAGAITFGIVIFLISISSRIFGIFLETTNLFSDLFAGIGYDLTYFGIFLGLVYGFISGFVLCYLYSVIYNKLPSKFK